MLIIPLCFLVFLLTFATNARSAEWTYDEFKNSDGTTYEVQGPTVVAVGPDLRYYIGRKGGIDVLTVNHNYVVTDDCSSVGLSEERTVLGIAFDPTFFKRSEIIFFASTSFLGFAGGPSAVPDPTSWGWANGNIDIFRTNVEGNCLARTGELVTGLPVGNHNHGVNGLAFNWDGKMLISNGGMTNAGIAEEGDGNGGYPATPLSGALLETYHKRYGFKGDVLYTSPNGRETQIRNNPDVKVYASGFMNAFAVRVHTNGEIYMTDNGPNPGYGRESTSCTTQKNEDPHYKDKFLRVEQGKWYGFPNRNRGRFMPGEERQCTFQPIGTTQGGKEPELLEVESSTNGIAEYNSGVLGEDFKGSMCLATFGFDAVGSSFSVKLSDDGKRVESEEEIFDNHGGLDMIMDRYASLVLTEYIGNKMKVFRPKPDRSFLDAEVALVSVIPDRGPPRGGNIVIITAKLPNPVRRISVYFGNRMATSINLIQTGTIEVGVPPGKEMELVHIRVVANGIRSEVAGAGDYRYMKEEANRDFPHWIRRYRSVFDE